MFILLFCPFKRFPNFSCAVRLLWQYNALYFFPKNWKFDNRVIAKYTNWITNTFSVSQVWWLVAACIYTFKSSYKLLPPDDTNNTVRKKLPNTQLNLDRVNFYLSRQCCVKPFYKRNIAENCYISKFCKKGIFVVIGLIWNRGSVFSTKNIYRIMTGRQNLMIICVKTNIIA